MLTKEEIVKALLGEQELDATKQMILDRFANEIVTE